MKRWLWALVVVIAALWLAQQFILKPIIETVASQVIGARVSLGGYSLNPFTSQVRLDHFRIYNEQGFPSKIFFDASEILVDADIPAILKGKIHCPLVVFSLDKMMIFKNPQGKLNVNELKIVQEKLHEKTKGPMPNFKIDVLKLNMEQVVVEDDGQTPPFIVAYKVDLKDKTIRNIDGVPKLVGAILFEALKPTALQGAGMYAATTLLGVGFLPGLAAGIIIASDDAVDQLPRSSNQVYQMSLDLVKRLGQVKKEDSASGRIFAKINGCDIGIEIQNQGWNQSKIIIKARKYLLARPEVAAGLIYQLKEEL